MHGFYNIGRYRYPIARCGGISGSASICVGTTLAFTDDKAGGDWNVRNAHSSISGAGFVTGISAGVDTILYSVTNSCGTALASKVIFIDPLPEAGVITGTDTICAWASIPLIDTSVGGTWSVSNSSATVSSMGILSGNSQGIDTIQYTVTNVCGTAIASLTVTVDPLPDPGTIFGASSVCIDSSITLADAVGGGEWSQTNSSTMLSGGGVFTGISAGVDTIFYAVTNSCGTSFASQVITVDDCYNTTGVNASVVSPISVFPNPAASALNIVWSNLKEEDVDIIIRDVAGHEVISQELKSPGRSGAVQLNVAGISSGIYFLTISGNSVYFTDKVVISK